MPTDAIRLALAVYAEGDRKLYEALLTARTQRDIYSVRACALGSGMPEATLRWHLNKLDRILPAALEAAGLDAADVAD